MISSDMILALKARWKLILAVMLGTLALAALWVATTPRVYIARAALLFDGGPNPSVQDNAGQADNRSQLGTQADILKSNAVARRVIQSNGLLADADLQREWRTQAKGKGSFETWVANGLIENLEVLPQKDTDVLSVGFKATDPAKAARIANSFASDFVSMRKQISTDAAKQYAGWFEERNTAARTKLNDAQAKLAEFQRSHGMVDGNTLALEADRLSSLSTQLASAESNAADLRARAGTRVSRSPDVLSTGVVEVLRQNVAANEAKVAELSSTYGDAHPDLVAARAELATLRSKLATETSAASDSVRIASSAASSRESQMQRLVNGQRSRMLAITSYQGQFDALQNDVNAAQKNYEAVTQRLNLMSLQAGLPTTNVQQVARAVPPLLPASPNVPLLTLLALLLGATLGVLAAMFVEWRRPIVRSAGGLFDSTDVPVIGSLTNDNFRPEPALALRAS